MKIKVFAFLILLVSVNYFSVFFQNFWSIIKDDLYFIPKESSIVSFRATQMNQGSGDWWLYGEDKNNYYALNIDGIVPKYWILNKEYVPKNFDKLDYTTWK